MLQDKIKQPTDLAGNCLLRLNPLFQRMNAQRKDSNNNSCPANDITSIMTQKVKNVALDCLEIPACLSAGPIETTGR